MSWLSLVGIVVGCFFFYVAQSVVQQLEKIRKILEEIRDQKNAH